MKKTVPIQALVEKVVRIDAWVGVEGTLLHIHSAVVPSGRRGSALCLLRCTVWDLSAEENWRADVCAPCPHSTCGSRRQSLLALNVEQQKQRVVVRGVTLLDGPSAHMCGSDWEVSCG